MADFGDFKRKGGRWCSASTCRACSSTSNISFFSFPKDPERCRIWAINAGRPDLLEKSAEYCYKNCKLCAHHFKTIMFLNFERNRLHGHAVPTIFSCESVPEAAMGEGVTDDPVNVVREPELLEGVIWDKMPMKYKRRLGSQIRRGSLQDAQKDLSKMDILVCGQCYSVFHFVEAFSEHKDSANCSDESEVKKACENEAKAQVWGYYLWKNKENKKTENDENSSPWVIYQRWCKLPEKARQAWIKAGELAQTFNKIATAKVVKVNYEKEAKDPLELESPGPKNGVSESKGGKIKKNTDQYVVEKILAKRFTPKKKIWEYKIKWENFSETESTWEPLAHLESCKDMVDEFEENLKKLRDKSRVTQASVLSPKQRIKSGLQSPEPGKVVLGKTTSDGRPVRSSKQKAIGQVKEWCGGGLASVDDDDVGRNKRPFEDDSDDSFEKRIKLEAESEEYSDSDKKKSRVSLLKKSPNKSVNNGLASISKNQILPENILIPDAKGVVRINQKQLPSLSSGVYIMSKTAGIIKLDSATSKIATSGGQAIVKVAPKVGQAQIKIVKKDGATTSKVFPMGGKLNFPIKLKSPATSKQQLANKQSVKAKPKKIVADKQKSDVSVSSEKPTDSMSQKEDDSDSDYGLEDLEFPSEPPVVEPDSPPSEFVLDPLTGKMAGVEYPEPQPEKEVEPEPEKPEAKSDEANNESSTDTLENLVKLAAADITEDDIQLRPDSNLITLPESESGASVSSTARTVHPESSTGPGTSTSTGTSATSTASKSVEGTKVSDSVTAKPIVKEKQHVIPFVQKVKIPPGNSNILKQTLQKSPVIGTQRGKYQQRIVQTPNAMTRSPSGQIIRSTVAHGRPSVTQKPKFQIASGYKSMGSPIRTVHQGKEQFARKIGNTTIYKSTSVVRKEPSPVKTPVKRITTVYQSPVTQRTPQGVHYTTLVSQQKYNKQPARGNITTTTLRGNAPTVRGNTPTVVYKQRTQVYKPPVVSKKEVPVLATVSPVKPKRVISMPSLNDEEVPVQEETKANSLQEAVAMATEEPAAITPAATAAESTDLFSMADGEAPIFITSDDGTVYQVAGQNEQGQTILVTQGPDGQQQCLLVTSEATQEEEEEEQPQEQQQQQEHEQQQQEQEQQAEEQPVEHTEEPMEVGVPVQEPLEIKTDEVAQDQVVAQVVRTEPPSPGGTHKVVVMLPDGNLMVTQVTPEEYASLELDK